MAINDPCVCSAEACFPRYAPPEREGDHLGNCASYARFEGGGEGGAAQGRPRSSVFASHAYPNPKQFVRPRLREGTEKRELRKEKKAVQQSAAVSETINAVACGMNERHHLDVKAC